MRRSAFAAYHPFVNFVYFAAVLAFCMLWMHPVFQAISLLGAVVNAVLLNGRRAIRFQLRFMLPLFVIMAAANPMFSHAGVTILFYMKDGNPVTLESILYGAAASAMYVTVIVWFSCYNAVMTSDKFMYLFGRIMPALSLIFAMVLRFVPRYMHQLKVISDAQACIGRDYRQGGWIRRARNGIRMLSIMTTWALENAIETADSMKSRGYGLPNRTSFSIFRFDRRDRRLSACMAGLLLVLVLGAASGANAIRYFPSVHVQAMTAFSVLVYAAYLTLCLLPALIQTWEDWKWKSIRSRN
ncbi:energy-coupling factor transporter transmembrane component T [Paenibacillus sacheonensis]|uniref:Energy-coupling factor transporter transmembrane protein EcfT n=1 Tax=Paenibacillus sacheonensis TaxID=742054 RepID=A0A7X4YL03_9BACL|nr:energy-coupling factor transporter transmembrane component T [Paenibacillus sacheonensis]MBM7563103.1 energy-coupling factor transport system permease protein [Paenibacillus sacheonensis]NBC68330.1 energy-coupling factor transporter transmembrane protein EcfT [Paenibacillus sacheonensis]